jgi:Tfp pilus assembly protein PilN
MKRINLLPGEAKKITAWRPGIPHFIALLAAVVILINLWQITSIFRYKVSLTHGRNNINKLEERLAEAQEEYAGINAKRQQIQKEARYIEMKLGALNKAQSERFAWADSLARLGELLPPDLWIKKITLNKEIITIGGTTFDNTAVGNFMAKIDASDYFYQTNFNYTQKAELTERPVINFEVTTHLRRKD